MYSSLPDRIRRKFTLRLTLWYAAVFILAYMALFFLAYYSLSTSLQQEDQTAVQLRFNEYEDEYRKGALVALQDKINSEKDYGKPEQFLVRVASPANSTLLLSLPSQWADIDLNQTRKISLHGKKERLPLTTKENGTVFEITSVPLEDGNFLQIGKNIEYREEALSRLRHVFAGVIIPAVFIGLLGGHFLTFRALGPIRNLVQTVRAIMETGRMEARVPTGKGGDELAELVILFNNMLERIENLVKGMQESLDNVAHDLRTPMTRLRGTAEIALQSNQDLESYREALADCMEESERMVKMLNTLMDISEAEIGTLRLDMEQVDMSRVIGEVVDLYRYVAEEKNVIIGTSFCGDTHVTADLSRMRQALANLLDNAVKYTPDGGRVDVEASQGLKQVIITVKDTGLGISEEEISKIWNRLYRGDKSRSQRGLGLGLSLVKSIIKAHGGQVEVAGEPGTGSAFTIRLPQE